MYVRILWLQSTIQIMVMYVSYGELFADSHMERLLCTHFTLVDTILHDVNIRIFHIIL